MIKRKRQAVVYICSDEYAEPRKEKLAKLKKYAHEHNIHISKQYIDRRRCCNPFERPQMKKLLKDGKAHKFDTVLMRESPDIARCDTQIVNYCLETAFANVNTIFLNEDSVIKKYMRLAKALAKENLKTTFKTQQNK